MKNSALKKIIISLVLVLAICTLSLGLLSACNGKDVKGKYHAQIYDRLDEYLNENYMHEHLTYYDEENFGKEQPFEQTFAIRNQEEFEDMFSDFPVNIDFEQQILFVHVVTTTSNGRNRSLKSIRYKNNELTINVEVEKRPSNIVDGSNPIQRTIAVVMDKIDITYVKFTGAGSCFNSQGYSGLFID